MPRAASRARRIPWTSTFALVIGEEDQAEAGTPEADHFGVHFCQQCGPGRPLRGQALHRALRESLGVDQGRLGSHRQKAGHFLAGLHGREDPPAVLGRGTGSRAGRSRRGGGATSAGGRRGEGRGGHPEQLPQVCGPVGHLAVAGVLRGGLHPVPRQNAPSAHECNRIRAAVASRGPEGVPVQHPSEQARCRDCDPVSRPEGPGRRRRAELLRLKKKKEARLRIQANIGGSQSRGCVRSVKRSREGDLVCTSLTASGRR